ERPGLGQVLGAIEFQSPSFPSLPLEVEDGGATAHHLMAHATIDIEAVLVERVNLIVTRLQVQTLVRGTEHGIGSRVRLAVDAADFQFAGNHQRQYLALRQWRTGIQLDVALLGTGSHQASHGDNKQTAHENS